MKECEGLSDFSLLGGPLHRLGCRLGLVRDGTNTTALGFALGALPWTILVALALAEGLGQVLFSIEAIAAHVHLLVAIPLFFVCEALVDPQFSAFVQDIVRSQVVPATARPALASMIARFARWREAWLPEASLLLVAVLMGVTSPQENFIAYLYGQTAASDASSVSAVTWTDHWYWMVCITIFRFLALRWLWRLVMWSYFLWRVSRLDLRLMPNHPDQVGGLGSLELVHTEFTPLILAISAVLSASLAEDLASGRLAFNTLYAVIAFTPLLDTVLFIGPLCVFAPKLRKCKLKGKSDYGELGELYVKEFERKWLGTGGAAKEALLGSADIQSMADMNAIVQKVHDMRIFPINLSMLISMAAAALLPLVPLLLIKYPLLDLLTSFFSMLLNF